jgi:hypothetical protein
MPNDPPAARVLFGDLNPGQTPIANFTALKVQGITTLRELDFHEAKNVFNAIVDYLKQEGRKRIEFDLESVKAVHRSMFCDVWEWAGQFRTCNLNPNGIVCANATHRRRWVGRSRPGAARRPHKPCDLAAESTAVSPKYKSRGPYSRYIPQNR